MATVALDKSELQKIIGRLSDEKLDNALGMFSTAVESIDAKEVEVEVAPNRPDMLSQHGLFRALRSFLGKKTGLKRYKIKEPEKNYEVITDKSVLEVRPYTACAVVRGLQFDDSKIKEAIDIQEKLHSTLGRNRKKVAIGIYPLEKIKLPIKYEARKPEDIKFVPLEASAEMTGRQILSGHPAGRDYARLLADARKFPVFVDASGEIMSMPPIINSHKTGKITEATKGVFIECSGFDFAVLQKCLNILVTMFADMGGEICQMRIKRQKSSYITPDLTPEKMKISLENCNKLLGIKLDEKDMKKHLERMGYDYKAGEAEIPAWRVDILHEHDLIEDIAIAYGYDKFEPEIPNIATVGEESDFEVKKRKIAEILAGLDMLEISSYHLTTADEQFKKMNAKKEKANVIEVSDSKTEYRFLRHNLLHCCLRVLSQNTDAEYSQRIFEIGRVFEKDAKQEAGVKETEKLSIAIADAEANFTGIKQVIDYLMRMLSVEYKIEPAKHSVFIDGRCGRILVNGAEIGHLGEISPGILSNLKIKMPVCGLEIDISKLISD